MKSQLAPFPAKKLFSGAAKYQNLLIMIDANRKIQNSDRQKWPAIGSSDGFAGFIAKTAKLGVNRDKITRIAQKYAKNIAIKVQIKAIATFLKKTFKMKKGRHFFKAAPEVTN
jgi:hypothetical protein